LPGKPLLLAFFPDELEAIRDDLYAHLGTERRQRERGQRDSGADSPGSKTSATSYFARI